MNDLKRLFRFIRPYKGKFSFSIIATVISTLSNALHPMLIGFALNELARNFANRPADGGSFVNFNYMGKIVLLLILTGTIGALMEFLSNYFLADVVQDTMFDIREEINHKIHSLPIAFFDKRQQGEILSRVTNDVDTVGMAFQQGFLRVLSASLTLVFSVVFMFMLAPFFSLIAMIMFPACFFVYRAFVRKSQPMFQKLQDVLGDLLGYIQEYYTGFTVVKLFGQEDNTADNFDDIADQLYDIGFKSNFVASVANPVISHISHLFYIFLFLLCALTVLDGPLVIGGIVLAKQMQIGQLQSFIQYVWQASGPISQFTQLSGMFQAATASLSRVMSLLDEKEETPDKEPYPLKAEDFKGEVSFNNVSFGYSKDKQLFQDVSFTAKSGDTIAIVGPTGAGKTTLINLLIRFYDIDSGNITIDGVDTRDMTRHQVRSLFGLVLQDPWLYHDTIANNIRFGNKEADDYQVVDAAKTANVHKFIRTLPEGYSTMISKEGDNISQGQKQLITIARVLISDPKLIILDEATSSVDTRLEILIQRAMKKAMQGRTSFIIAHRLSTIRDADLILVMDKGSIIETGTHEELIDKGGMYKDLYESQFQEN